MAAEGGHRLSAAAPPGLSIPHRRARPRPEVRESMNSPALLAAVPTWFVVLPDTDEAAAVAATALPHAAESLPHASGRPWLMGRWNPGELTAGECGGVRLAVLGGWCRAPGCYAAGAKALRRAGE